MRKKNNISLKTKLIAHIETWRPYTVIWCGLISLCGVIFTNGGFPSMIITLLAVFIPILGWISGLYLSDYLDKKLDTIQKAHRPLPSKRMAPSEALLFGGFFAIAGISLTLFIGTKQLIFVVLAGILVFTYSKYTKSNGVLGNINRGLLAVISYLFGVFAVDTIITDIPVYVWLFAGIFFLHDVTTNIVGTLRDIDGDKKEGYQTLPVKYGPKKTIQLIRILIILWFLIVLIIPINYNLANSFFYLMMVLEFSVLMIIFLVSEKLMKNFSRKKALNIHKIFVLERINLAFAVIFLLINPFVGILIYIFCLLLTAIFQIVLRDQYEFNKWTL